MRVAEKQNESKPQSNNNQPPVRHQHDFAAIDAVYQDPSQIGKPSFPSKGVEEIKPYVDEKVFKLESEIEEIMPEESGYTIIGGDEIEVLPEESTDINDESVSEEE